MSCSLDSIYTYNCVFNKTVGNCSGSSSLSIACLRNRQCRCSTSSCQNHLTYTSEHAAKRRRSLVAIEPIEPVEPELPPSPMSEVSVISNYDIDETFYPSDDEHPKKRKSEQSAVSAVTAVSKKSKVSVDGSEEPVLPLEKYTVAELKKFLSFRNCPVSGRKADLITRLQTALGGVEADKENMKENTPIATKQKHKLLSPNSLLNLDNSEAVATM